jgi:hypothetical protein
MYSLTWLPQARPFKLATNRWKTHKTKEAIKGVLQEVDKRRQEARDQRAARGLCGQRRKVKLKLKAVA